MTRSRGTRQPATTPLAVIVAASLAICGLAHTFLERTATADVAAEPSIGCSGAVQPELRDERERIVAGNDDRSYIVDAPASEPDKPRPLVLAFHGFQSSAAEIRRGVGMGLAARAQVIAVAPDGHEGVRLLGTVGRGWDLGAGDTRDVDFVRALLDRIERERCVDRRRIYATGMSNGAFFASLLGCRLAERIAAIAPVAGGMALPSCTPARPVPVLMIFGRADDIVPPQLLRGARDWWAQVDGCGGPREDGGCTRYEHCAADVVVCEGPQRHAWPADATERIWKFFVAHPRS